MKKTFTMSLSKKKILLQEIMCIAAIAIISFIFALQASNNIWRKGNTAPDSSVFKYIARVILNGGTPYIDVFDHKGPLIYLINVLGIQIAEWRGVWVFEFLAIFVTFYFMYKISRIYTERSTSLLILLISSYPLFSYFEGGNLTEEYAMPFITISLYIFVDYFVKSYIDKLRLVACGFSFGAILMLRPNMCSVWVVMCFGVLLQCIFEKNIKVLIPYIIYFLVGMFLLIAPICIWLISRGAMGEFINDYIVFNMKYSSPGLIKRVNCFAHFINHGLIIFSVCGLLYVCAKKRNYFDILYLAYVFITLLSICISGRIYNHYGMILVPALAYMLARIIKECRETSCFIVSDFLLIYLFVTFAASGWLGAVQNAFVEYSTRHELFFGVNELEVTDLIVKNSNQDDKIIVLGNWNIIYNLSNRFAASKYSFQSPPLSIDSNLAEEFYQEIMQNEPKVIVLPQNGFAYDWMTKFIAENSYYELGNTTDGKVTVYGKNH